MSHKRGKGTSWHNTAAERCTWAEWTREGTEAGLGLSCSGALIPAAPMAGDNWGRAWGILSACQSCAIATRADGAGTARRDLPVRQVNTQSSFKALSLNTLTGSPSTQSCLRTVGSLASGPALRLLLKFSVDAATVSAWALHLPGAQLPHMHVDQDHGLHALLPYDGHIRPFFQSNCSLLLGGL